MKILPVKKSADFKLISSKGQKFYSKTLILLTKETSSFYFHSPQDGKNVQDFCRVGFTVAKTVSKSAVKRNSIKRKLREAFKNLSNNTRNHFDYIVIARKEILEVDYQKICTDLKFCLKHIHQKHNSNKNPSKS